MINKEQLPITKGSYKFNSNIINWFDLKGKAEVIFRPHDIKDLQFFLQNIDKNINVQTIGAGSNVIIADEGVKGVLVKLSANFANIEHNNEHIKIQAATRCQSVAQYCINNGLGGLEFLSGIPGSIGGAIAMNAGCYGSDIASTLISAEALDYQGNFHEIKNQDFNFYYRGNKISKDYIFIAGTFKFYRCKNDEIANKVTELQNQRSAAQPIHAKTSGSTFKNPPNIKAWELIDKAGFRGKSIGDAKFSEKHCNFLINTGNASAKDILELGNQAKKTILEKYNIELEWEIKLIK